VVGSGYRLMFSLNPYNSITSFNYGATALSTVAKDIASAHTKYGTGYLPDSNWTSPGNSFMIRPYELEVVQNPGGDGVDLGEVSVERCPLNVARHAVSDRPSPCP